MKALVIGAGGFVGYYLTEYLRLHGFEVFGTYLDFQLKELKDLTNCICMDVCDYSQVCDTIGRIRPEHVYNLAAVSSVSTSWKEPQTTMQTNCIGFLNILEAIKSENIKTKVLVIGSSEEYGEIKREDNPIGEDMYMKPSNPYSISKYTQELFGILYNKSFGLEVINVRAFNHAGPRQSDMFVISDFCKRVAMMEKGLLQPVLEVGNLEAVRDFTDVRDIVRAYSLLMTKSLDHCIYNVGSGRVFSIRDILDIIISNSNVKIKVVIDKNRFRPIDIPYIQCDNKRLVRETGWHVEIPIEKTISDTIDFWRTKLEVVK